MIFIMLKVFMHHFLTLYLHLFRINKIIMRICIISLLSVFVLFSCKSSDGGDNPPDNGFDRENMLTHWANHIIVPAYTALESANANLNNQVQAFTQNPSVTTLSDAQAALTQAYTVWQTAAFYEVGPAKNENIRSFFNTYPTNITLVEQLALADDYQLHLISNASKQGYPALDYLLFGFGENPTEIVAKYTSHENAEAYKNFINALSGRLLEKSSTVKNAWDNGYKNSFIENDGSSASASVDLIANDFLLYYEKFFRNGKVRFPVGYESGSPSPVNVESYYNPVLSKTLLATACNAMKDFFEGKNYASSASGAGFKQYLMELDKQDVANEISEKFDAVITANNAISGTYVEAVENDRTTFLNMHDKIQENVIPMKVDMLQAMNISVAYFDGDGD